MTKKRFIFHKNDGEVEDTLTGEFYEVDEYRFDIGLVHKMNELSNENEQLKSDVYDWKVSAEDYLKLGKSLKKENEQLKSAIKDCIRISESNGALSPMRLKSIFYHFELNENKNGLTYDQCPKAIPCPFCSCIMKPVRIEEKEVIYRCSCCKKYKGLKRLLYY